MITDIKGFTERTSQTSRNGVRKLLDEHESLLLPMVAKFRGTLVKNMGDAFMVSFESPTNAVLCAVMMQDKLRGFNEGRPDAEKIQVRIALNAGEVEIREGDVFGEAVNVAARIEGITEADEIYFTESVYLAMNKAEVPTSEIGLRRFKGIPEAIKLYRVIQDRESEKYRQLIDKLKTRGPSDTDIQMPPQVEMRPARRIRPRIVILVLLVIAGVALGLYFPVFRRQRIAGVKESVLEAVEAGDFGLALARADKMMAKYPEEKAAHEAVYAVVEAEARRLKEEGKYEDALQLLEERAKERAYLNTAALEKEVLLEKGAVYAAKANYAVSSAVYRYLLDKFQGDEEVLRETIGHMGIDYDGGPTSVGVLAAFRLAEKATGNIDDAVGRTLTEGYLDYSPFADYARDMRALLIKRYQPAVEAARKDLTSEDYERRVNSYHLLKEAGAIKPDEELRYHFDNMRLLSSSYQKVGRESLTYLAQAAKAPDWPERKKALAVDKIGEVKALTSWSDYQREVSALLAQEFYDDMEPAVTGWLEGEDEYRRANAFEFFELAGRLDKVDVWKFHADTLVRFDVNFIPVHFQKAVEFFKGMAGTERAEDARKALDVGRAYVLREVEAMERSGSKRAEWSREHGLRMIEEALAALGGVE